MPGHALHALEDIGKLWTRKVNPNVAKAGALQSQGTKGDAVVLYRNPLVTPDLECSGFPEGWMDGCSWANVKGHHHELQSPAPSPSAPIRKYGNAPRLPGRPDRKAREVANSLSYWRAE